MSKLPKIDMARNNFCVLDEFGPVMPPWASAFTDQKKLLPKIQKAGYFCPYIRANRKAPPIWRKVDVWRWAKDNLTGVWDETIIALEAMGYGPAKPTPNRNAAKAKKPKVK